MFRYSSYPNSEFDNPFIKLISEELKVFDIEEQTVLFRFYDLYKSRNDVSLIWIHWPNALWRSNVKLIQCIKVCLFFVKFYFAKYCGYKIVWSAHNVLPHGKQDSKFELFMRRFIAKSTDLVIGHAVNTEQMLAEKKIIPEKYVLAVHGHYEEEYKLFNRKITRESLGFQADDKIILLKSNGKNFEDAKLFLDEAAGTVLTNVKILLIGQNIATDIEYVFIKGFVSDKDLAAYMRICDLVCLPYQNITTSGAYFLALTFLKPVLAKESLFFLGHTTKKSSFLYTDEASLALSLKQIDENFEGIISYDEILKLKNKYTWAAACEVIAKAFIKLERKC
jgi:beta-1,4-mannosyltransferase